MDFVTWGLVIVGLFAIVVFAVFIYDLFAGEKFITKAVVIEKISPPPLRDIYQIYPDASASFFAGRLDSCGLKLRLEDGLIVYLTIPKEIWEKTILGESFLVRCRKGKLFGVDVIEIVTPNKKGS